MRFSLVPVAAAIIALSSIAVAQPAHASFGSLLRDVVGFNDYTYGGAPYRSNRIVNRLFGPGVGYDYYDNYPGAYPYDPNGNRGIVGRIVGSGARGFLSRYAGRILTGGW